MSDTLHFHSLPNAPVDQADLLILPVPLERSSAFKAGTAAAPGAILAASDHLELFEEDAGWSPFQRMQLCVLPEFGDTPASSDAAWHAALQQHVAGLPQQNLLIAVGGEHALTPAIVAGRMPEPGTVLYLDAHADLRDAVKGNPFHHNCTVARLLAQGHKVILAGVRSMAESEVERVKQESRISLFMDWDLRGKGQWESFLQRVSSLKGKVYLSIDLDVCNPGMVPGVRSPQPGGFFWYQLVEIIEALCDHPQIELCGVDLVEMVPDAERISEITAAKLLLKIASFWGMAKRFDRRPANGGQI